jgi:hypothetical protein
MVHSVICQLFFLEHAEVLKQSMYVCWWTPCDLVIFSAAGEDDGAVKGERKSQEGWRPAAPLRQLHLVKWKRRSTCNSASRTVPAGAGAGLRSAVIFSLFPDIASNVAVTVVTTIVASFLLCFWAAAGVSQ